MYLAVAGDVIVVADIRETSSQVVSLALVEGIFLRRPRCAAVQHYQCYGTHLENWILKVSTLNDHSPDTARGGDAGD